MKYTAHLCVRGDLQLITQAETYAATLAARTFRALMAVTAAFDLEAHQLDAVNAFTNSIIDEVIYLDFPEGFEQSGFCLLLLRALYGLRRSPLLWFKDLSTTLAQLGLHGTGEELCLYTNDWLTVLFYVDDIVALCRTNDLPKLHDFKKSLMATYKMKDHGDLNWFLGICVVCDRTQRKLWLCQDSYINKMATTFHLEDINSPATPMTTDELLPFEGTASPHEVYAYQCRVGSLLYAATITRPDVARTAAKLSEFLRNPSPRHSATADRAITYLNGTKSLAIEYSPACNSRRVFMCASDAAFTDDTVTRRSTEGYLFQLFGGAVDWRSTK